MKIEFNEKEMRILREAVEEYEENHYQYKNNNWQRVINRLIDRIGECNEKEI